MLEAARAQPAAERERRLVRRLRAGEEAAFAELVRAHAPPLLRTAESYTRSRAVAEEVVQETFLGVVTGIARFEERSSLRTWLFRIVANRARTRAASEGRSVPFSGLVPALDAGDALDDGGGAVRLHAVPEERLLSAEARGLIDGAIARLPELQRRVITLRDVHGWPPEEVRATLGVSDGYQRVLLHRARATVRRALAPYLEP
jgi:RNA polymerase sigma-70 factor (ECF subfamily)